MKNFYLLGLALAIIGNANGQSMSENFDSRSVGDYMGVVSPDWTTWSGTVGGAEDVQVTDVEAASGSNSIYFSTVSPGGGPQDVLVPFGGVYSTGDFVFESKFYVESGKGAYFNFQGETSPGAMYTLNCFMVNDGSLHMDAGSAVLIETTYPSDTWFTLKMQLNLNTNDWELYLDDELQGIFSNPNNQVASADLYPVNNSHGGNNIAGYFMDDVMYEHTPYILPERNAAVTEIYSVNGLATAGVTPNVKVRNLGTSVISSFDIELMYDGTVISKSITGISLESLDTYEVEMDDSFILLEGENEMIATVSNVNGIATDDDSEDDVKSTLLNPIVPAPGKVVLGEEATGTWCGWCPRGAVYLEFMDDNYSEHFIGIAVHNGDPMVVDNYDTPIGGYIAGYPSMLVDRGPSIDPSAVESDFLSRIVVAPKAGLTIGSDYTEGATSFNVSVTADFLEDISGDYRLGLIVVEDHVTGIGSGYNQRNYYAGGGAGVMGGYEALSDPVPAADMVYDHVARAILPAFGGMEGSFPATVSEGETHSVNFSVELDEEWVFDEIHLVGFLVAPDNTIDNAGSATIEESADNGLNLGVENISGQIFDNVNIYPNPAADFATISIGNCNDQQLIVSVFDVNGALVVEKNYGILNGVYNIPLNLDQMSNGMYNVRVIKGDQVSVKRLIVK